jgi:hypothetical protein
MDRNGGQAGMFFDNPEVRSVIQNWMLDQVYDRIRVPNPSRNPTQTPTIFTPCFQSLTAIHPRSPEIHPLS